jgi:hypothetical protein
MMVRQKAGRATGLEQGISLSRLDTCATPKRASQAELHGRSMMIRSYGARTLRFFSFFVSLLRCLWCLWCRPSSSGDERAMAVAVAVPGWMRAPCSLWLCV